MTMKQIKLNMLEIIKIIPPTFLFIKQINDPTNEMPKVNIFNNGNKEKTVCMWPVNVPIIIKTA